MLARVPLIPIVLLALSVSLIATVMLLFGVSMAGGWNTVATGVVAAALAIPMALAFSHGEHAEPNAPSREKIR
jgi:hypothetical protein